MEFASATFLFVFLPIVFLLYILLPWKQVRNWLLIAVSLLFYAWGEPAYVLLMLFSVTANYFIARWIGKYIRVDKSPKAILIAAIILNIGLLAVFKYTGFVIESINGILNTALPIPQIPSPLGISFFTFQILSYIIDVYRRKLNAVKNYSHILLYISFFAQLVQGPIIRYGDIESQLGERKLIAQNVAEGLRVFIVGLAMKLLIANTLGGVTSYVFAVEAGELNAAYAWAGAVCFLLQIYFDFAGYSQMAIGLGAMFGFTIPGNFNYPYIAYSMTDFWRRWHITLSRWFRDYVYIPLGGNRGSALRTGVNKLIVFLLTGLWHGASWNFVVWGAYNGAFLLGEGFARKSRIKLPKPLTWVYTIIVVTVGFVIFNSPSIGYAWAMIKNMFTGFDVPSATIANLSVVFKPFTIVVLCVGIISATPIAKLICQKAERKPVLQNMLRYGSAMILLALCLFAVAAGNYNPSIYAAF